MLKEIGLDIQTLSFLHNCTISETTGYAPFYLMFGCMPCLAIDILFFSLLNDPAVTSCDTFVTSLVKDLKEASLIAQACYKRTKKTCRVVHLK